MSLLDLFILLINSNADALAAKAVLALALVLWEDQEVVQDQVEVLTKVNQTESQVNQTRMLRSRVKLTIILFSLHSKQMTITIYP